MRLLCLAAALLVLLERGQSQQHDLTVAANEGVSAEQEREQAEDEEDEPARQFKATREWQEVQPGEVLPRGVHVRLNLETGRREAKRLDDEEPGESQKRTDVSNEGRLLLEEAKDDSSTSLPEKPRAAWRAEEFKKKMSSLKLKAKSDSEIVRGLLDHYRNATAAGKEPLLRDLEFLVHQYDTAVDFIRMDGLLVIVPDLNSTSETLRELVAFTLGSALQGNPQVQSSVLEFGLLPQLLRLVAMDPSSRVRSRCLFALSCLVRHLPAAQEALMHHGGLTVLAGLFAMGSSSSAKLQLKAVTLIHDLLVEQRLRQGDDHAQVNKLQEGIQLYGLCSLVPELLQSPDVDAQEKVVQAMLSLAETCRKEFQVHLPRLRSLLNAYQREVHSESQLKTLEQTDYFEGLLHSLSQLLDSLERKQKDEL
uniref:Nucleotide exchange factor SIL1 n=1 Tax=Ixodes ricinus TaxID=34613 RepID=A0A0K8RCD7_IXORI